MVAHVHKILQAEGLEFTKSEISAAFPRKAGSRKLFGVWSHIARGFTHNAVAAIQKGLRDNPPKPKKTKKGKKGKGGKKEGVQRAGRQRAEVIVEPFVIIPPEIEADDCPICHCKLARPSAHCPSCGELL